MGRGRRERGSVLIMVVLALGIFLFAAIGLGIDGSRLYSERVMAQAAADAAAQAAIMSIFNGTHNNGVAPDFPTSTFNCTAYPASPPCVYAQRNSFATAADTVVIDFPDASAIPPGITLSESDPTAIARATVTRRVDTTLMRLFGSNFTDVRAKGIAAIVDVIAPVPILVTHPTNQGSFSMNGNPAITICGGPGRSIQVNSSSATSLVIKGNPSVDLSKAGPNDSKVSPCTTGTGADFGDLGGPAGPSTGLPWMTLGVGHYIQPASPIRDPLYQVPAPSPPSSAPAKTPLADGVNGCPTAPKKPCQLYSPGRYCASCTVKRIGAPGGETAVFKPGVYYMDGIDFADNTGNMHMYKSTGFADDTDTGQGILAYATNGARFFVGSNGNADLLGTPDTSIYKGILLFQDRNAATLQHKLGGGGDLTLTGTVYLTNTLPDSTSPGSPLQHLLLQGNPGSTTLIIGMIIVSELELGGNAGITMQLDPDAHLHLRQVALVK